MLNLHPYTLALAVFVVLLLKAVVARVGKQRIQDAVWTAYVRVGSVAGASRPFKELKAQHAELATVTRQKKAILAQDEYAKWTKLNRRADKLAADISVTESAIANDRAAVNKAVSFGLLMATTAPVWFARVWYRKAVLFYLPPGVIPYYVEWALALPFVATGGIGLTIWMFTANHVLASLVFLVSFPFETAVAPPVKPVKAPRDETAINAN